MKKISLVLLLIAFLTNACNTMTQKDSIEKWKKEILDTEKEFAALTLKEGISTAFLTYAAKEAVLMRNNKLIIGREAIQESYKNNKSSPEQVSLTWKPDFVDVSSSGDMGYTYGKYVYTSIDTIGNPKVVEGVFHTVWKRQADGTWKFVWD